MHGGDSINKSAHRRATVKALSEIIRALKKKGYGFVTVPELLNLKDTK